MADRPGPPLIDRATAQTVDAALSFLLSNGLSELTRLLVPFWTPNTAVPANAVRVTSTGTLIRRTEAGVTRASYDAAEAALWTVTGGTDGNAVLSVAGKNGAVTLTAADVVGGTFADSQIPSSIARDSELDARLAALVNASPSTLDTLNELAAALGNDPNYATTIATALSNRVSKTGNETIAGAKTFTSAPVVPTPTADNQAVNRGYVASSSFVRDYNTATSSWPARGNSSGTVMFVSTRSANAERPSDMAVGDLWIRHPDATS